MTDDLLEGEAERCPLCGGRLSHSPDGKKVVTCPEHGEMILSITLLEIPQEA